MNDDMTLGNPLVDFANEIEDKSKDIIKVIGVGGGGCNAVGNMYKEGIANVSFAVCNTDTQALKESPVPVKIPIGELGAGGDPAVGREEAQKHTEVIKHMLDDGTKMVFVTAGMGGGTGTGAAPIIAGMAKQMGMLTIGVVTIPFYFEKTPKIIKALKGVEEMRKNVDALLIINNERICDIYSDSEMSVKEAFRHADSILFDATKSISELITISGTINLDFRDVETTMRGGGGAIMTIGRAAGPLRVQKAIIDALDSPLLYGNNITKARRILLNIYTSEKHPLLVKETKDLNAFMDALGTNVEVIDGISDDNSLDEDVKVTILATGFDDDFEQSRIPSDPKGKEEYFERLIAKLYKPYKKKSFPIDFECENYGNRKLPSTDNTADNAAEEPETGGSASRGTPFGDGTDNTPAYGNADPAADNSAAQDEEKGNANAEQGKGHNFSSILTKAKGILARQIETLMQDEE